MDATSSNLPRRPRASLKWRIAGIALYLAALYCFGVIVVGIGVRFVLPLHRLAPLFQVTVVCLVMLAMGGLLVRIGNRCLGVAPPDSKPTAIRMDDDGKSPLTTARRYIGLAAGVTIALAVVAAGDYARFTAFPKLRDSVDLAGGILLAAVVVTIGGIARSAARATRHQIP
jgi:hypothetical protein